MSHLLVNGENRFVMCQENQIGLYMVVRIFIGKIDGAKQIQKKERKEMTNFRLGSPNSMLARFQTSNPKMQKAIK